MLTAIVIAHDTPGGPLRRDSVARSLASLVDACVRGLVGDAVLVGPAGRGLEHVADDAGCALIESPRIDDGLRRALDAARHDAAFVLRAGYAVERGFVDEVNDHFAGGVGPESLVLRAAPASVLTRLAPSWAEPVGAVASRAALRGAIAPDLRGVVRRLRCAELASPARRTF
jgi:hypothetical protein